MLIVILEINPSKPIKKRTTNSYAGGKSSGMAIENPYNKISDLYQNNPNAKPKHQIKLKIYKNGFKIDNGPFRPLTKLDNKKYIEEINKKLIPQEYIKKGIKDLEIAIEDNKTVNYNEPIPEKQFKPFVGRGRSVGRVNLTGLHVNKNANTNVIKTKPTCKIHIRLYNGEMVNKEFNLNQTVRDLKMFVEKASGSNRFQLLEGFPPKVLTELNKTIEELKLNETTLTQKLI